MGAIISLASFDFSSIFSSFSYFLSFGGRQIYKYKMKTDLKTNTCHTGSTEIWISSLTSTTPTCYDNKENSVILSNLRNPTSNKSMMKEKIPENTLKTEHCQSSEKYSELIPMKKNETTTNNSKSSPRSSVNSEAVKNSVAIKNRDNTIKNCSTSSISKGNMSTNAEIKHQPLKRSVNNKKNRRPQNGDLRIHLQKYIEAVQKFGYDSGYVHGKCDPDLSTPHYVIQNCLRPGHMIPPHNYQTNCRFSNSFNAHHIGPFKSDHPPCYVDSESLAVRPYLPLPKRQMTKSSTLYPTYWQYKKYLFERTHWFCDDNKTLITNEPTPKANITKKPIVMPPVTLLPSASDNDPAKQSCNHENNSYIHEKTKNTPDTNLLSKDYTATTPGDLAVQVCHMLPQNQDEEDCLDADYESFSDMEIVPCSSIEYVTSDDEDMDGGRRCSNSPRKLFHSSIESDSNDSESDLDESESDSNESESDSDESDDSDEFDGVSIGVDFEDDLETDGVEVDAGVSISSSWFVRPDCDSDTNDDADNDDDWDTTWSSSSLSSPDTDTDCKEFLPEFTFCTVKISCTEKIPCTEEKEADVSAVEEFESNNLQKLKEANEKWDKFYGDEHFTLQEEKPSKVQFATGKKFSTEHIMVCWDFAYRAARKGPWIQIRIDAERFQKKIDIVNIALAPILDPCHRQCIMTSRFQQAADKIA